MKKPRDGQMEEVNEAGVMEWVSGNKQEWTWIDWKHGQVVLYVAKLRGSSNGNELECIDAVEYNAPGPSKKFMRFKKITPTAYEFSKPPLFWMSLGYANKEG